MMISIGTNATLSVNFKTYYLILILSYLVKLLTHNKFYNRNCFEVVTRLCIQLAYGDFDDDGVENKQRSEISALEKTAVKFGPSFPVKAYTKVLIAETLLNL